MLEGPPSRAFAPNLWRERISVATAALRREPRRFAVALRTGTPKQLSRRIAEARESGLGDTPQAAAEKLLELVAAHIAS